MPRRALQQTQRLDQFNRDDERAQFRYTPTNQQLAEATRDLFLSWFLPRALWPLGRPLVYAIMDDRLLDAVGFPRASPLLRGLLEGALRLRARALRLLPARRRPRMLTQPPTRTYPHGYRIEELGSLAQQPERRGG